VERFEPKDKKYAKDNRLMIPENSINGIVWHLDVGSSHPGTAKGPKGSIVH